MSTRRTRPNIPDEAPAATAAGKARMGRSGREIEHMPALSAGSEHWRERIVESEADGLLQHERGSTRPGSASSQSDAIDFDIAARLASISCVRVRHEPLIVFVTGFIGFCPPIIHIPPALSRSLEQQC